jgi:hypothetical protein
MQLKEKTTEKSGTPALARGREQQRKRGLSTAVLESDSFSFATRHSHLSAY